jgi:hypothetical protein
MACGGLKPSSVRDVDELQFVVIAEVKAARWTDQVCWIAYLYRQWLTMRPKRSWTAIQPVRRFLQPVEAADRAHVACVILADTHVPSCLFVC